MESSKRAARPSPSTQPQRSGRGGDAATAAAHTVAHANAFDLLRLPAGALKRVIGLLDAKERRALRAASPALRRLVCGAARELTLGAQFEGGGDAKAAAAARHVAARAPLWHRVQGLVAHQCDAEGLLGLLEAAARHWPSFERLELDCDSCRSADAWIDPPPEHSWAPRRGWRKLGPSLVASPIAARLASLSLQSQSLGRLKPLAQLPCLARLKLSGSLWQRSSDWLPPGLKSLELVADMDVCGIGGPAWLRALSACTGLESLRLWRLTGRDFCVWPARDEGGMRSFCDVLGRLTTLQELSGFVYQPERWEGGDPESELEEEEEEDGGWEDALPSVDAERLLPRLPRLRRLALYTYADYSTKVLPWVAGSLRDLAAQAASNLEELALTLRGAAAGAQPASPFPNVRALHLSACRASDYPRSLASTFPNCRHAIFGDNANRAAPPAPAVAAMGARLESLALNGANAPSIVPALAACTALTELQLASSEELKRAVLLRTLRALPRIERLNLCLDVDPPLKMSYWDDQMDEDLVAACSRRGRPALTGTARYSYRSGMWPQPSLVPVDEWTYHPHFAR